jgi:hypothetical protein
MSYAGFVISEVTIFIIGAVFGAKMVYHFRYVTTKELHQVLLNTLYDRTARLDRLMQSLEANETLLRDQDHRSKTLSGANKDSSFALRVYREA